MAYVYPYTTEAYVITLDNHDCYGPFWDACNRSALQWAYEFANARNFRSFQVISKPPHSNAVLLPITRAI